jgi:DNA primase
MVHESLRKLAHLAHVPEAIIGVGQDHIPNIYIKKSASIGLQTIDPDRIIESDFLRWLLLCSANMPQLIDIARSNLQQQDLRVPVCRKLYQAILECLLAQGNADLLSLAICLDDTEGQLFMSELLQKKVNTEKAESLFLETIQRILNRNWMEMREDIKIRIHSGQCTDDEVDVLMRKFDELKRAPPQLISKSA